MKEYELCFEQLRFYDTRQEALLKYLCTLTSAIATAEFALYQFLHGPTADFLICETLLGVLVFIATLLLFAAMLQNRLYFVFVARQLNAIRGYLMKVAADGFEKNQMYTSTTLSALKVFSVHTIELVGTALMSALFGAAAAYGFVASKGGSPTSAAITMLVVILVLEIGGGAAYLRAEGKQTADRAINPSAGRRRE